MCKSLEISCIHFMYCVYILYKLKQKNVRLLRWYKSYSILLAKQNKTKQHAKITVSSFGTQKS